MDSIYDLRHEVRIIQGKRVMVCSDHFCDIDGMTEAEYYKERCKRQNLRSDK